MEIFKRFSIVILILAFGCIGTNGVGSESEPTPFASDSTQGPRVVYSEMYLKEKALLEEWEKLPTEHYTQLRFTQADIRRLQANWTGRFLNNPESLCWQANTFLIIVDGEETGVLLFRDIYPDNKGIEELMDEIEFFRELLKQDKDYCKEQYGIVPP